jgi:N-methylhydantoinase B
MATTLNRDPERVGDDVLDGYVTRERAERDYGVVLDPETLEIIELR